MLHSGHLAAKLLIDNRLTGHKAHFLVGVEFKVSPILWSPLQCQVKQTLNSGKWAPQTNRWVAGEISQIRLQRLICSGLDSGNES